MRSFLWAGSVIGLVAMTVQAQGGWRAEPAAAAIPRAEPSSDWSGWTRPLGPAALGHDRSVPAQASTATAPAPPEELDVVDAHWMALTMWGEARGQGEEAMRAVGHVIDNRRRTGGHGAYVTETVSEAWQFSCWNEGDPNREAMLGVLDLPRDSSEYRLWLAARRIADDILAGRSRDPTGGALFYHAESVAPDWSRGIPPVRRIGTHLFFRNASVA